MNNDFPGEQYINEWDNEKKDYDFCLAKEKEPGKEIGHYEQLVWADTSHVGCGKAKVNSIFRRFSLYLKKNKKLKKNNIRNSLKKIGHPLDFPEIL